MARYCRSTSHYADVECAYAEPERYLVLIAHPHTDHTRVEAVPGRVCKKPLADSGRRHRGQRIW
jgi:hypothetical protein